MVQNKNGVCTQNSFALLYAEYKRHFLHTLCMNHAEKILNVLIAYAD